MNKTAMSYEAAPFWRVVNQVRLDVTSALADRPRELREAAVMTATELVENAVKYSAEVEDAIRFEMSADERRLRISVSNRIASPEDRRTLALEVERIRHSEDPRLLYVRRLYDLMNQSGGERTRLGLIRIAYEGQFALACRFEGDRATLVATRCIINESLGAS
ncbi:MAG: hypothetical protein ACLFRG_02270 [Desulfococcaceae bacterium]